MSFVDVVIKPIAEEICPQLNGGRKLYELESEWGGDDNRVLVNHAAIQETFRSAAVVRYILMGVTPKWAGDQAYLDKMGKIALQLPSEIIEGVIHCAYKDGTKSARNPIPIDANPPRRHEESFPESGFFSPEEPGTGE